MKKLFLILSFVLLMIGAQAQAIWFNTSDFRARTLPEGEWSGWERSKMSVSIDFTKNHLVIYSKVQQIIDWTQFSESRESNADVFSTLATDANYKIIMVTLTFYDSGLVYLRISYSDGEYEYQLVEYD